MAGILCKDLAESILEDAVFWHAVYGTNPKIHELVLFRNSGIDRPTDRVSRCMLTGIAGGISLLSIVFLSPP